MDASRWICVFAVVIVAACGKHPNQTVPKGSNSAPSNPVSQSMARNAEPAAPATDDKSDDDPLPTTGSFDDVIAAGLAKEKSKLSKACKAGDQRACVDAICTFVKDEKDLDSYDNCARARGWRTTDNWVEAERFEDKFSKQSKIICRASRQVGDVNYHPDFAVRVDSVGHISYSDDREHGNFASVEEAANAGCHDLLGQ